MMETMRAGMELLSLGKRLDDKLQAILEAILAQSRGGSPTSSLGGLRQPLGIGTDTVALVRPEYPYIFGSQLQGDAYPDTAVHTPRRLVPFSGSPAYQVFLVNNNANQAVTMQLVANTINDPGGAFASDADIWVVGSSSRRAIFSNKWGAWTGLTAQYVTAPTGSPQLTVQVIVF